jgi:demethylmenaquinone methyltransferase/2-methoxy-6-polyprenyl-1,4-benzoquinol methylase
MTYSIQLSEKSKQIQLMFDKISSKYDFLNRLLSFGQDIRWRNAILRKMPKVENKNGTFYDVACGTGDVLFSVLKKQIDYTYFSGFDISQGMLDQAENRLSGKKVLGKKIQFVQASAEQLPVENATADCLAISFGLRNVDDRQKALNEFYRVLKLNGTLFVLEFFTPQRTLMAKFFDFYFKKILPFIGGVFSDKSAYEYLPKSVSTMPDSDAFIKMLKASGFSDIEQTCWLAGGTRLFKANKK